MSDMIARRAELEAVDIALIARLTARVAELEAERDLAISELSKAAQKQGYAEAKVDELERKLQRESFARGNVKLHQIESRERRVERLARELYRVEYHEGERADCNSCPRHNGNGGCVDSQSCTVPLWEELSDTEVKFVASKPTLLRRAAELLAAADR